MDLHRLRDTSDVLRAAHGTDSSPGTATAARRAGTRTVTARLSRDPGANARALHRPPAGSRSVRSPADGWSASVPSCQTFSSGSRSEHFLHVGASSRAAGIGSLLSAQREQISRTAGDVDMVLSATPSKHTVSFSGPSPMPLVEPLELERRRLTCEGALTFSHFAAPVSPKEAADAEVPRTTGITPGPRVVDRRIAGHARAER